MFPVPLLRGPAGRPSSYISHAARLSLTPVTTVALTSSHDLRTFHHRALHLLFGDTSLSHVTGKPSLPDAGRDTNEAPD